MVGLKRIAILAPYVGLINRGAETFVIELTKSLNANYEIDVFSTENEKKIDDNVIKVDVKKTWLFSLHDNIYNSSSLYRRVINKNYYLIPDIIFQRKFSKKVFKIIKRNKIQYDILFPNNGIWGIRYSKKYKKKHGTPYIYTGHGGIGPGEKYILQEAPDAYVALTSKQMEWAKKIADNNTKIVKIPNGVNISDFDFKEKKRENKEKVILSVGALTSFKRHELTINAVSHLENVRLIILGTGEEESKLIALAEEKIKGKYIVTNVPYSSIVDYYRQGDVFVLPSEEEPFGIVYLEAMASNLPVVVPDDVQRREIVGKAGIFCNVENENEYSEAITKALGYDWGNIPREQVEKYDWKNISKRYQELIEKFI